jgi:glutamate racemase
MSANQAAVAPQAQVEIHNIECPTVQARQAIGGFDSGSGGMVASAFLSRILRDSGEKLSVVFFGDTANLPYGKKTQQVASYPTRSSIS